MTDVSASLGRELVPIGLGMWKTLGNPAVYQ